MYIYAKKRSATFGKKAEKAALKQGAQSGRPQIEYKVIKPSSFAEQSFFASECATRAT